MYFVLILTIKLFNSEISISFFDEQNILLHFYEAHALFIFSSPIFSGYLHLAALSQGVSFPSVCDDPHVFAETSCKSLTDINILFGGSGLGCCFSVGGNSTSTWQTALIVMGANLYTGCSLSPRHSQRRLSYTHHVTPNSVPGMPDARKPPHLLLHSTPGPLLLLTSAAWSAPFAYKHFLVFWDMAFLSIPSTFFHISEIPHGLK
jgi:hypothetical protein